MGLFSFGKSSAPPRSTKVWQTGAACLKGIAKEALLSKKASEPVAIVTVFEDSQNKICKFFDDNGISYNKINLFSGKDALESMDAIHVIDATSGSISKIISTEKKINLLFYGKYPYLPAEKKLTDQLTSQFPASTITFCISLDDAIFDVLGADNLKPMMETLGMKEDEFLEHKMISSSINRAMEKFEKQVTTETKAHSERDWFAKNVQK